MPKYSAKQRKLRGRGKSGGPRFMQLFHYVKRSTSYHGLGFARALLIELIDRYNGSNNGMIVLGVREAAYELRCGQCTVGRGHFASSTTPDSLGRPSWGLGAAVEATEWRLMWRRCDKTATCRAPIGRSGSHTFSCSCPHRPRCRSPMPRGLVDTAQGADRPSRKPSR